MQALTFFFYCFVVGLLIAFIAVSLLRRKSTTKSEPTFDNQLNEPPVELVEAVPTAATFRETLFDRYTQAHTLSMEQTLLGRFLNLFTEMYAPPNQQQYDAYLSVCSQSLVDFTRIAPQICLEPLKSHSVFRQQCNLRELSLEPFDRGIRIRSPYHQAYKALADPFLRSRQQLPFLDWTVIGPGSNYRNAHDHETMEDSDRYMKNYFKAYDEEFAQIKRIRPYAIPLMATPLFVHAEELVPTDLPTIPFELPEEARFRGQWIVGALCERLFIKLPLYRRNKLSVPPFALGQLRKD
jgi:hypothetical protein